MPGINNYNIRNNKKNNYLDYNVISNETIEGIISYNIPNQTMFNFNKQQNLNNPSNKKRVNTAGFNNNINNINNNLNTNISFHNILSPFSPYIDFFSPRLFSSNLSSPNVFLFPHFIIIFIIIN